jgi:hypothetical protein
LTVLIDPTLFSAARTPEPTQTICPAHEEAVVNLLRPLLYGVLLWSVSLAPRPTPALAQNAQHDFDWEIGMWHTHLERLLYPLTDSARWVEYEGTSAVGEVWGGGANLVELDVEGPEGRLEVLSLRLYDPRSGQWTLNSANRAFGLMSEPMLGGFRDGRGEFFGQITMAGRAIFVRFVITKIDDDTWRFVQAFSDDGGQTWQDNWIATDTRMSGGA